MTNIAKYGSVIAPVLIHETDIEAFVRKSSTGLGLLALMLFAFPGAAWAANEDNCTAITVVPITISIPGPYCLTTNLSTTITSGVAITVSTNGVTIDLGGHTLSNLAAGTGTVAVGIAGIPAGANLQNITVRNGTVRGFYKGISLVGPTGDITNSSGHLVENVRADFNRFVGMEVLGAGSVVRQNQILHTGGSTAGGALPIYGLSIGGNGAQALDNTVVDTTASAAFAYGIVAAANNKFTGLVIEGNRVTNVAVAPLSIAIVAGNGAENTMVVNNRIADFDEGIFFENTGKYRDNLTTDTTVPYTGGTDEGNNK